MMRGYHRDNVSIRDNISRSRSCMENKYYMIIAIMYYWEQYDIIPIITIAIMHCKGIANQYRDKLLSGNGIIKFRSCNVSGEYIIIIAIIYHCGLYIYITIAIMYDWETIWHNPNNVLFGNNIIFSRLCNPLRRDIIITIMH